MAGKLLIRMFDVGLGDCIYCRIPDGHEDGRDFHILIDCGSLSGLDYLTAALEKLKIMLPDDGAKKRLDLLIVTHQHKDHILGFTPDLWADFSVGALWMSAAMDPDHPEARNARQLHAFAGGMIKQAQRLNFSPELEGLFAAYAATNDVAVETLQKTIPVKNNIKPVYVHAGMDTDDKLKLPLKNAALRILGPENDIDLYYLGKPENPSYARCHVRHGRRCKIHGAEHGAFKINASPDQYRHGRFPAVAVANAVDSTRLRRSRWQGDEQYQRRSAHRMEG